jgi:cytosine deaminase
MAKTCDILIRNCVLRRMPGAQFEIAIDNGVIVAIDRKVDMTGKTEIDAGGNLVTESYVSAQTHLDKAYTLEMVDPVALQRYESAPTGNIMAAIDLAARVKDKYSEEWVANNARRAVALAAYYGNTHIRGFTDVDTRSRLEGVKGLIKLREEFKGIVDIQVTAFAQDGIQRDPGTLELLDQAMALGADVIAGNPWIEYTNAEVLEHVGFIFDIAQKHGCDISMPADVSDDPGARSLEMTALEAIKRGYQGRVVAHQCRASALYPRSYLEKVIGLVKKAGIILDSVPHPSRLHAPIKDFLANDVVVCLGQDDIADAYYPFGRNNLPEVAFVAAHLLWMRTMRDMDTLYDMITVNAGMAIRIKDFGLKVGGAAHLVVLDVPTVWEAIRDHDAPAHVISHGKLVDQKKMKALGRGARRPE